MTRVSNSTMLGRALQHGGNIDGDRVFVGARKSELQGSPGLS